MKLPSYRRIIKTDYAEEYQALVEKMAVSINSGFDSLYDALNKKLTFNDNIISTYVELNVTVDVNGALQNGGVFKLDASQTVVRGLIILDCYTLKTPNNPPNAAPFISFSKSENSIILRRITGLTADVIYTIKILAI